MSNEQTIEEEIARVIDKALDDWQGEGSEVAFVTARLSPLLNRVRAEALRDAARFARELHGEHESAQRLEMYAAVIEQNSEGNET